MPDRSLATLVFYRVICYGKFIGTVRKRRRKNPMDIRQSIAASLSDQAEKYHIADVRIGIGYTAVMLEGGKTGLAGTPIHHLPHGCTVFDGQLPLTGKKAIELLSLIRSSRPIDTAVGLATANALANKGPDGCQAGDVLHIIEMSSKDHVGMVGHFAPMIGAIKRSGAKLTIFEQIDFPSDRLRPAAEIPDTLPRCSIALITATSIINATFDKIISYARNCRQIIVLGASTPLIPSVFAPYPVTFLSGVIVTRPEEILHIVSCGGGMRRFKEAIQKVNLAL